MEEKEILAAIGTVLEQLGFKSLFVVGIDVKGSEGGMGSLKVFLDGEEGVSIDQCASVSRKLSPWLEERDLFKGRYRLEVSSPGADQPLVDKRQYPKHSGRKLSLMLSEGKELKGVLVEVLEDGIVLNSQGQKRELRFDEIEKAKVLISF